MWREQAEEIQVLKIFQYEKFGKFFLNFVQRVTPAQTNRLISPPESQPLVGTDFRVAYENIR